ncbi:hypothetical protein [Pseudomonas brassicacearum]|uniref:hypothetical protein n=1 Tax=Pseudomonas brassicacearum TaxID=930166 RepID=UPI0011F152E5|nr:hypothetical protein [Pseudomonas brassicacearum]QEO79882.1 hypothetical protein ELZ14_20850 [Pseudomonas brassicacearum]
MNIGDAARNPLGIIGLFISLIYGFANWMLGSSVSNLQPNERLIIIWFIVVFPVLILATFCYLVVKHHGKLYAPKDYKKDESFLQTLNEFDSFVRLSTETSDSPQETSSLCAEESEVFSERHEAEASRETDKPVAEVQPEESIIDQGETPLGGGGAVNTSEHVKPSCHDVPSPASTAILSADNDIDIIEHAKRNKQIAKMKELLDITRHYIDSDERFVNADVRTNVKMGSTGVVYDAAAYTGSGLQCLEVKFINSASSAKNLIMKYINQARVVKSAVSPADFHLKLVLIHEWNLNFEEDLRKIVASLRIYFQDFISVELVARPSVRL